jgi:hypothetical protein
VYEPAKRSPAATAASIDPDSSTATSTIRPQVTAASIADSTFIACARLSNHGTTMPASA